MDAKAFIADLNQRAAIPGHLNFVEGPGGLPVAEISNGHCKAAVSIYGAHVMSFHPKGAAPVLWMSAQSYFTEGKPIRGGIPLCWPWFGLHPTDSSKPGHGFARIMRWNLAETAAEADGSSKIVLTLSESEETFALWPHPFTLELTVIAGKELRVSLSMRNTGETPFTCTAALHTYFEVGKIEEVSVEGLDKCRYIDTVGGTRIEKLQKGPVTFDSETDRIYLETSADCRIDDPGLKRSILIKKHGSKSTVVWNPWVEKSKRMPDFGDEEYHGMLCVETCNAAPGDEVTLKPGVAHKLEALIKVEELH
ncbi:MAG: D-hexose-6-phosphate mutarotase [Lentisphaerae bacterium GWF2_52_8]|nr:MAG: D-hexose-6-phosphate mutarotase [Lentisphaerae bacterium GWF2_52_8]